MIRPAGIWRNRLRLWLPALVFCLLNLAVFSTYRLVFAGQAQLRKVWLERDRAELAELEAEHSVLEDLVHRATANRERIDRLYDQWLAPARQRLTRVIAEVKDLAHRAGLEPKVINYPEEELEEYGLVKRSIVFTVEGNYVELRRLINFLELSETFLTLEEVGLAEGGQAASSLRISLGISTLFAEEPGDDPVAAPGRSSS
ncbi:MAG: hypothetical protein V3T81_01690 [Thermoanaerobaculia bacterium]